MPVRHHHPDDALAEARSAEHGLTLVPARGRRGSGLLLAFAGLTAGGVRGATLRRAAPARPARCDARSRRHLSWPNRFRPVLPGVAAGLAIGVATVAIIAPSTPDFLSPRALARPRDAGERSTGRRRIAGALAVGRRSRCARPAATAASGGAAPSTWPPSAPPSRSPSWLAAGSRRRATLAPGPRSTLAAVPLLASFAFAPGPARPPARACDRMGLRASRRAPVTLASRCSLCTAAFARRRPPWPASSPSRSDWRRSRFLLSRHAGSLEQQQPGVRPSDAARLTLNEWRGPRRCRDERRRSRPIVDSRRASPHGRFLRQVADAADPRRVSHADRPRSAGRRPARLHGWRATPPTGRRPSSARLLRPRAPVALEGAVIRERRRGSRSRCA